MVVSRDKPRVVFWNNIPSPYVVERFNLLAERGNIDIEVWFNEVREPDRSWDVDETRWKFRARYISPRLVFGKRLYLPLSEIYETQPDVLVCLYYEISFALGSLASRCLSSRTLYSVMPTYDAWSKRTWWRELSKHILFRSVDGAQTTGPEAVNLTRKYGLPESRAYFVTQSINVANYRRAQEIAPEVRKKMREQLGLTGCVFLYVGRLWAGKGLDYLFEAYKEIRLKRTDVSLLLVGDGVDETRYRAMARELPGVVFAGFVQADAMAEYYALGDVLVFPTLGDPYGHVVREAMAAGLPVISTESAGEIRERISDGYDGFIVPPADTQSLKDKMLILAEDPALRKKIIENSARRITAIGHEDFARDFEALANSALSAPPRRTVISYAARGLGGSLLLAGNAFGRSPAPYVKRRFVDES